MKRWAQIGLAMIALGGGAAMGQGGDGLAGDAAPAAESESMPRRVPTEADLLRVRRQLDQMLTDAGLPIGAEREDTARRIEQLAEQSAALSRQLSAPRSKLEATNVEMRAYNALAQQAYQLRQPQETTRRNLQLRQAAEQARQIEEPAARTVGDFWLLQADLLDLNDTVTDRDRRQREAIELLERFVAARQQAGDAVEFDDTARKIATDVRLSLLRLYDERGQSESACRLVRQLRAQADATADDALREHVQRWYAYCDAIGMKFEATLPRTPAAGHERAPEPWSTAALEGRPLLMHFWASWWPASHASWDDLAAAYPGLRQRGVEVVSIDLAPPPDVAAAPSQRAADRKAQPFVPPQVLWPCTYQPVAPDAAGLNLQDLLGIRSLPRYLLLDERGVIRAIGGSLAIIEQLPPPAAPAEPKPVED